MLRALSLSRNPMPPRITRKSDRRKVSDRTMVGTAQPVCLSASGIKRRRYESTMNLRKRKIHRGSFQYGGWTARPFSLCLAVAGEEFVLTSPFIERDYRKVAFRRKSGSGVPATAHEHSKSRPSLHSPFECRFYVASKLLFLR